MVLGSMLFGHVLYLMALQQDAKGSLHLGGRLIAPQNDEIDTTRQIIFGNQKTRPIFPRSFKCSLSRVKSNIGMQNSQLIADDRSITTDTTKTSSLMRTKVIIRMQSESCGNSETTQCHKSKPLYRLLSNVAQTGDVSCLIDSLSDPLHELGQLLIPHLAIFNSSSLGSA
jgi:hypothetical protein